MGKFELAITSGPTSEKLLELFKQLTTGASVDITFHFADGIQHQARIMYITDGGQAHRYNVRGCTNMKGLTSIITPESPTNDLPGDIWVNCSGSYDADQTTGYLTIEIPDHPQDALARPRTSQPRY